MQGLVSVLNAEVSVRTNMALLFGGDSWGFGPFLVGEKPHAYSQDAAGGLALRFGREWTFEVGGGALSRTYESSKGSGTWAHVLISGDVGGNLILSLAANRKELSSGDLEKRVLYDLYPQVGAQWFF